MTLDDLCSAVFDALQQRIDIVCRDRTNLELEFAVRRHDVQRDAPLHAPNMHGAIRHIVVAVT